MKKLYALILLFVLSFSCVASGCGDKSYKEKDISSDSKKKNKDKNKKDSDDKDDDYAISASVISADDEPEEEPEDYEPAIDLAEASMNHYYAFLEGRENCTVSYSFENISKGSSYDVYGLVGAVGNEIYNWFYLPMTSSVADYGFIDGGLDGVNELALKANYKYDDGEYYPEEVETYMIIRFNGYELELIDVETAYYRTWADISTTGYIMYGGSNGAYSYSGDHYYITGDGRKELLYTSEYNFTEEEPYINCYDISDRMKPYDYPSTEPAYEGYYMFPEDIDLNRYYWIETLNYNPYVQYGTPEYDAYLEQNIFFISDGEYNVVDIPPHYASYYYSIGLNVYGLESRESILNSHFRDIGINPDWITMNPVEWTYLFGN